MAGLLKRMKNGALKGGFGSLWSRGDEEEF